MKINVEFYIKDRWIDDFFSFLSYMKYCSDIGHSENISFYVDGDGDFRFNFNTDIKFNLKEPKIINNLKMWDAG